jgi:hypothetical protein
MGAESEEAFDAKTRERIRLRILHYKKEHRLGVGRLAKRITLALPNEPKIPVKTLQRFLAGIIRTNDLHVGFFEKFADGLPDPDPIGDVGKSMAAFYGTPGEKDYAGVYSGNGVLVSISKDFERPFNSQVVISSDAGFWRITERMGYPDHAIYDGVLVCSGKAVIAVMKDQLRGLPRTYTVWPRSDDKLHGCGTTVHFVSFDPDTVVLSQTHPFEITLGR